jgi:hypothetical protein
VEGILDDDDDGMRNGAKAHVRYGEEESIDCRIRSVIVAEIQVGFGDRPVQYAKHASAAHQAHLINILQAHPQAQPSPDCRHSNRSTA